MLLLEEEIWFAGRKGALEQEIGIIVIKWIRHWQVI
jgi:hypothetical protein